MKKLIHTLRITDVVVITFYVLLIILNIIFFNKVKFPILLLSIEVFVIAFVFFCSWQNFKSASLLWKYLRLWYVAPLILLTFKQLYFMVHPIHSTDYDGLLIKIDRMIFGTDPTVWIYQFSHPILTELLQIVYNMFYLLPLILGVELWLKKKWYEFDYSTLMVVYGFFLSYLGYFSLPAVGPRFTLHDFDSINTELPGLLLTNILREFVNIGESIPTGTTHPMAFVQRDVFPSGHTQITLVVMYLSLKWNAKTKYFLIPAGILLIIGTVYLRYHYVIDLIAGAVFMLFTLWSGKLLYNWWAKITNQDTNSLKI
ncbi:MAG: phosphatase PAP2 family protein [Ignavibacteria bacterium]|nr:phosphatase PAP2 family protein [Ignavibacteria bacterium]